MKKKKIEKIRKKLKFGNIDELRESVMNNFVDMVAKFAETSKEFSVATYKLNDPNVPTRIRRVIKSGLPAFDLISAKTKSGSCGVPIGRQIEIAGPESSGKTSLACQIAGSAQSRLGWNVVWLEHENKFDPDRAALLGLDGSKCIFAQPDCLEDTIEILDKIFDSTPERIDLPDDMKMFGTLVVVDSVAAMPSRKELEGDMNDNNIGLFQRKMSQAQRRITNRLSKRNITIIWINQNRAKLGSGFRPGTTTYGGAALKYYCSQRWKLWSQTKDNKSVVVNIENVKNQCGIRPFLKTRVVLNFEKGFDYIDSFTQACEGLGIASRIGNSTKFSDVGPFAGAKYTARKMRDLFIDNQEPFYEYEKIFKEYMKNFNAEMFLAKMKDETKDEGEK